MSSAASASAAVAAAAPAVTDLKHTVTREYEPFINLKYGCNPHQNPAQIMAIKGHPTPFKVLHGTPGYINLMDAMNSWQLVSELRKALHLPAAASFKHVSPAGCAVAVPLSDKLKAAYDLGDTKLTPQALAYVRARMADPKCSFGDWAAMSDVVDEETALVLKREVSDGVIAAGFTDKALAILKEKKGGSFIVLQADPTFVPPPIEYREVFGVCFAQKRNDVLFTADHLKNVVTAHKELSEDAKRDLILASIAIKYTQSNSVGYALDGQMIGVGAGQQSRVDCVKLAGSKADVWYLRQHPKVLNLKFKPGTKRVDKINAQISYIEGDFTQEEYKAFLTNFDEAPEPLTREEKASFLQTMTGVSVSSDAFFPFRDNVDHCSKRGVKYIAQPGGSVQDAAVIKACDEYGMTMAFTNLRLFHH